MMEKKGLALFLLSLSSVAGFAQSQIRGNVKDSNGEPILGATIKVNGSKVATVTDMDGNFSVNAKPGSTITISYVGFETQTVTVKGTNLVPIVLKEDDRTLNDVVVIGYGVQKKSDLTGAVASVSGDAPRATQVQPCKARSLVCRSSTVVRREPVPRFVCAATVPMATMLLC